MEELLQRSAQVSHFAESYAENDAKAHQTEDIAAWWIASVDLVSLQLS